MNNAPVQTLLDAVRRCLWQARLMVALRFALWATAGMMLVVVAVHLTLVPMSFASLAFALAAPWTGALAWAARQRPGAPACALWADRHLGGASAFSTLLETNAGTATNAQARRWLEDWTNARVPGALHLLDERKASPRLARPLSSMVVCLALAGVVLQLPGRAPSPPTTTVAAAPSAVASLPVVVAEAPAALVSEISRALRATEASGASEPRQTAAAAAAGPGRPDAGRSPPPSQLGQARETSPAAQPAIPHVHAQTASGATSADTASTGAARASLAAGAGGGREAGDSRDGAAGMGVTRVLQAPLAVQRSDAAIRQSSARSQADMDRPAAYDEEPSTPAAAAARPGAAPAAAAPPAATEAARLTPTETSYVQAWMRASAPHR